MIIIQTKTCSYGPPKTHYDYDPLSQGPPRFRFRYRLVPGLSPGPGPGWTRQRLRAMRIVGQIDF